MSYAIDLNPRQTTRIIEQALRHRAPVILEPRIFNDDESLRGQFEASLPAGATNGRPASVVVTLLAPTPAQAAIEPPHITLQELNLLVGTCCDGIMSLGESRYLFDADVVRVEPCAEPNMLARVYLTRPESLQVMQRRRFSRFRPARSTQVELRWQKDAQTLGGAIAWLCNISPDGLACRTERRIAEQLWIGDRITLEFTLAAGENNHFVLDATLCSKTPGGTDDKTILGLQFTCDPGNETLSRAVERLRVHLQNRLGSPVTQPRGAES